MPERKSNRKGRRRPDRADALYTSEQRYRKLVETMGDGLSEIDENQVTTYANDRLCILWKRKRDEIVGRKVIQFLDKTNREILEQQLILRRQGGCAPYEISWTLPDGSLLPTIMTPTPYFDGNGCFKGSFAVVTDISEHKKKQQRLKKAHDELEERVAQRTAELREKTRSLEDVNTALRVLLKKREEDERRLEERMVANIRELVFPYIEQMKSGHLDHRQTACLQTIESTLNEITSPFLTRLSLDYRGLTPSEIRIANLVKHGSSTKDIADMLNLSGQTIEFYRKNIRKKLGLTNRSVNLRTFLNITR